MATIRSSVKITPCLWFDQNGEEAANYYVSVFKNSEIKAISRYGKGAPLPEGTALTVSFTLDGQHFTALNGGPLFKFTEAVSFMISCKDQQEVDHYWDALTKEGVESMCGWLKDKYGLSWQVVPDGIGDMLSGKRKGNNAKMMQALMKMKKLDIKTLEDAFNS